ncbi:hypothetical protein CRYUN_Cryun04dG0062000 [Craigia yunnanensis]
MEDKDAAVDGMNLTLDETLGDSNPHYCRVLREKTAAREAAHNAMKAHKEALVEASWCRILQAARIRSKEAEDLLLKAEKTAAEAFESATALGVIMHEIPNCPQSTCQVETSSIYKADEFKDLLRKINENPDTGDSNLESIEFSSACESEPGSELETLTQKEDFKSQDFNLKMSAVETRQRKFKRRHSFEKFNTEKLVEMMLERKPSQTGQVDSELPSLDKFLVKHMTKLEREVQEARSRRNEYKDEARSRRHSFEKFNTEKLVEMMLERFKCLQEDELSSLATIVATRGLNAVLAEVENTKLHNRCSMVDHPSASALNFVHVFNWSMNSKKT